MLDRNYLENENFTCPVNDSGLMAFQYIEASISVISRSYVRLRTINKYHEKQIKFEKKN